MAFLDGRACPFATAPNQEPERPCPDPDVTGPITDLEGLYPIGEDGVLCYEIGDDRRVECRYDAHVIQLTRELRLDDVGTDVGALQTRLIRLAYLAGTANVTFDIATESAVRSFQAAEGLTATGVADIETLDALGFDTDAIVP
jgi:hypothetical protein